MLAEPCSSGQRLNVAGVVDALYHATALKDDPLLATFVRLFPEPALVHETPPPAAVDDALKRILLDLRNHAPVAPGHFFAALLRSETGQGLLASRRASPEEMRTLTGRDAGPPQVRRKTAGINPGARPKTVGRRPVLPGRSRMRGFA